MKVADMGKRCAGCLVVGDNPVSLIKQTLVSLLKLKLPIVYIDRKMFAGSELGLLAKRFSFCRHSEEIFSTAAAQHLYSYGHRRIGYVSTSLEPWQITRRELLNRWAEKQQQKTSIVAYPEWVREIRSERRDDLASRLESMTNGNRPHVRKALRCLTDGLKLNDRSLVWPLPGPTPFHHLADLLHRLPDLDLLASVNNESWCRRLLGPILPLPELSDVFYDQEALLPFLFDPDVTALIVCRDRGIPQMQNAFRRIGIEIPKDLSVISYDNDIMYAHHSISSVDTGIADLGYQAFHAIEHDIPMRFPFGKGCIMARPWVADRHSVAAI